MISETQPCTEDAISSQSFLESVQFSYSVATWKIGKVFLHSQVLM